ncbi:MAG: Ppx/GppA family phosphatase [Sporomusaceae bacterium]|nr:Ppx/GppA family phosphatase [Sporomusaceae bacterium]
MTERVGIIDLGSNSARLIIVNIYANGAYNLVYHQKESVRLGEGLGESKRALLNPKAVQRAIETLNTFAHMCQVIKVDKILPVATAAVRGAEDGAEFIALLKEKTGISFRVINGLEEARLGYLGVMNTIDVQDALLFDLGGASTEITLVRGREMLESVSLPIGAVNMTEKFKAADSLSHSALTSLVNHITAQLTQLPWLKNIDLPVVGIGGTARNIAKIDKRLKDYPFDKIHNYRLGKMAVDEIWKTLIKTDLKERKKIAGLNRDRADIILAGVTIIKAILDISGGADLIVSGAGVREGIFYTHYFQNKNETEIIPDILNHSTWNALMFYKGGNAVHHLRVSEWAQAMFDAWQPLHQMNSRHKRLLKVAATLHDIGISIDYYEHERHSAYLVENAALYGLTHREQVLTAIVAGLHHGYAAKYMRSKLYSDFLEPADVQAARKLSVLLALAEGLEITQTHLVKKIDPTLENGKAHLKITAPEPAAMEIRAASEHLKWFKKEFGAELVIKQLGEGNFL